ncbi:Serine acetyltransferase [Ferriphaselus amnicola]|uniref:Serine acetyltransferase n=1 Tax=Ferriphaselus amnicola TaxID=1188319 RepID=A0A2Z6G9X2_9PROT|nr:hypothetical protein [Ferriphaselus amnicola]BBE50258.1 Serine acetyltransferase [Ferriphaselus amnicola]
MALKEWLAVVGEDINVFRLTHPQCGIFKYLYYPDFRAVMIYRLSQLFFNWRITRPLAYLCTMLNDLITGVWIGPRVVAGPGLSLGHPRGLVVNPDTRIGHHCSILQRVTIGGPNVVIGDYVSINGGAAVISNVRGRGCLTVGNHVIIGAGAVVLNDVPDCSVVVGVPGRVVKTITPDDNWFAFTLRYLSKKNEVGNNVIEDTK